MKDFLIRKLGGFTIGEVEKMLQQCEDFAVDNLKPIDGVSPQGCSLYVPFDGENVCVIRSRVTVMNGRVSGLKFAPWCKNVAAKNISSV